MRKTVFLLLMIAALGLSACTRSLSDSPTQIPGAASETPAYPAPAGDGTTDDSGDVGTGIEAGEFATQTAQAAVDSAVKEPDDTGDSTGESNTDPEATEAAPEATDEPEPENNNSSSAVNCDSPYTVKDGDWVWNIGRRCDIHPQDIIAANNLYCYYDFAGRLQCPLQAGDKLVLPANARAFP